MKAHLEEISMLLWKITISLMLNLVPRKGKKKKKAKENDFYHA